MHVALVSHRFPPDGGGGVERYTETLAISLAALGDTVSVLTRRVTPVSVSPVTTRESHSERVSVYRFAGGGLAPERFLRHAARLETLFEEAIRETAPEVLHVNHVLGLSPRSVLVARRQGIGLVISLLDFYFACPLVHLETRAGHRCAGPEDGEECARRCFPHEGPTARLRWGLRTAYFRRLLSMADRIVCPSRHMAGYFEAFGIDPARIRVLAPGIPTPAETAEGGTRLPGRRRDQLTVAFLGAVVPHKGVHRLLDALRVADLGVVEVRAIGWLADAEYARALEARAREAPGLRFRLHGGYAPPELPGLLRDVDCVVTPSLVAESFSFTTREALAAGVPVLVARLGALPEAITEGVNGFTFDPDRPEELASLLRRLVDDASLLDRLRVGARHTRLTGVAEHAMALRAVYRDAVAEASGRDRGESPDVEEIERLHAALIGLGLGAPLGRRAAARLLGQRAMRVWRRDGLVALVRKTWRRVAREDSV